jgi:hypothetical protein
MMIKTSHQAWWNLDIGDIKKPLLLVLLVSFWISYDMKKTLYFEQKYAFSKVFIKNTCIDKLVIKQVTKDK